MELYFYTRPNCSLCDRLEQLLLGHLPEEVAVQHRNILDNRQWYDLYRNRIPVLTHGETVITEGRPTPQDVEQAIAKLLEKAE